MQIIPEVPTTLVSVEQANTVFHQAFVTAFITDVFVILMMLATIEALRDIRSEMKRRKFARMSAMASYSIPEADCE